MENNFTNEKIDINLGYLEKEIETNNLDISNNICENNFISENKNKKVSFNDKNKEQKSSHRLNISKKIHKTINMTEKKRNFLITPDYFTENEDVNIFLNDIPW